MAFLLHRRLAIPLWAIAFVTLALTAPPTATLFMLPPTTVFAMAAIGILAILFLVPGAITRLGASRSLVRVVPSGYVYPASARIGAGGTGGRKLDESNATPESANHHGTREMRQTPKESGGWRRQRRS